MVEEEGCKSKFLKLAFLHRRGQAWHCPMEALEPWSLDYRLRSHWITHWANFWAKKKMLFFPENEGKRNHISLEKDGKSSRKDGWCIAQNSWQMLWSQPGENRGKRAAVAGECPCHGCKDPSTIFQRNFGYQSIHTASSGHHNPSSRVFSHRCDKPSYFVHTHPKEELITQTLRLNWTCEMGQEMEITMETHHSAFHLCLNFDTRLK